MQTFINRTDQNNDHTGIIHTIQFRSSFRLERRETGKKHDFGAIFVNFQNLQFLKNW